MDQWPALVQLAVAVVVFGGLVGAAAVYIRSAVVKARHEELQALADTRGDRISDLESKVARLEGKVSELELQLAGQAALVTEDIATRVAELLRPLLGEARA